MPKFTSSLNLPQYASAPSSPSNGDVYYNTTASKAYARVGGAWVEIGGGGAGGNAVYYQASAPVSANTGDLWFDSDDNTIGDVVLTDSISSTSTTTAATPNSVKTAYDASVLKSTVTTAGDIIYATGSNAVTRLGLGSENNILTAGVSAPAYQSLSSLTGAVSTIPSQAANDIPYATSTTALGRISNGTTGQVLTATTGAAPAWANRVGMDVLTTTALNNTVNVTYSAISQNYKYVYLVGYCSAGGNFYLDSFTDTSAAGTFSNYYSVSGYTRASAIDQIFRTVGAAVTTVGASGTQNVNMTGSSFSVTSTLSGITQLQFSLRIDNLNTTTTKILTGSSNCQTNNTNGSAYCTWFNASLGKSSGGIFGITGFRINFGTAANGSLTLYGGY